MIGAYWSTRLAMLASSLSFIIKSAIPPSPAILANLCALGLVKNCIGLLPALNRCAAPASFVPAPRPFIAPLAAIPAFAAAPALAVNTARIPNSVIPRISLPRPVFVSGVN